MSVRTAEILTARDQVHDVLAALGGVTTGPDWSSEMVAALTDASTIILGLASDLDRRASALDATPDEEDRNVRDAMDILAIEDIVAIAASRQRRLDLSASRQRSLERRRALDANIRRPDDAR